MHGAADNNDAWTSVGHANFIQDNLLAAGKAKPMIVVMPAGHVSRDFTLASLTNQGNSRMIFSYANTGTEIDSRFMLHVPPNKKPATSQLSAGAYRERPKD